MLSMLCWFNTLGVPPSSEPLLSNGSVVTYFSTALVASRDTFAPGVHTSPALSVIRGRFKVCSLAKLFSEVESKTSTSDFVAFNLAV